MSPLAPHKILIMPEEIVGRNRSVSMVINRIANHRVVDLRIDQLLNKAFQVT